MDEDYFTFGDAVFRSDNVLLCSQREAQKLPDSLNCREATDYLS